MFNDPALGITWPEIDVEIKLSEKDQKHPPLAEIEPWEEK
jgi:dTDP-4-dehydrorhamnose 3,5-epimerase-like enzyme